MPCPFEVWSNPRLQQELLAGLLDIAMAALINQVSPAIVLKAIAAGLMGKAAFAGAAPVVVLGFVLQMAMSVVIAFIYVIAAAFLPQLLQHPLRWGAAFGIAVFLVMNGIVVPLSAYPKLPRVTPYWVASNLAAMLLFGMVIAFVASAWPALRGTGGSRGG